MGWLLVHLNLALLQFASTDISCWISSCTVYARADLSFMFKLFCHPNLFRWKGDWAIGKVKSTTPLLWPSCGQHFQGKKFKQKGLLIIQSRTHTLSSVVDLKNFIKWQKLFELNFSSWLFQLFTVLYIVTTLISLNEDNSVVHSDFLTSISFSHPQSCLDCRLFEEGTSFHHVLLSVCHNRMLPPDYGIQKL